MEQMTLRNKESAEDTSDPPAESRAGEEREPTHVSENHDDASNAPLSEVASADASVATRAQGTDENGSTSEVRKPKQRMLADSFWRFGLSDVREVEDT